jgi:hypothetical protein
MHSCLSVLVCVCMVCKSLRMHFTPTSVGHTQSVRPSTPPSWKAVTNWHDHPLSSSRSFLMVGVDKYIIISPKSGQTIIQTVCWVCPISGLNRKNPVIILASNQKYSESKTSIVTSFKLVRESLFWRMVDNIRKSFSVLSYFIESMNSANHPKKDLHQKWLPGVVDFCHCKSTSSATSTAT